METLFLNEKLSVYLVWELKKRKTEEGYKWSMIHEPIKIEFEKIREFNCKTGERILHKEENFERLFEETIKLYPDISRMIFDASGVIVDNGESTKNKIKGLISQAKSKA